MRAPLWIIPIVGMLLSFLLPGLLGNVAFFVSFAVAVVLRAMRRRRPRDPYQPPDAIHPR